MSLCPAAVLCVALTPFNVTAQGVGTCWDLWGQQGSTFWGYSLCTGGRLTGLG